MADYLGVIEGYYGKRYTNEEHEFLFDFMRRAGYRFFIYAPKEDPQLRDEWRREISAEYACYVRSLAESCGRRGLDFGIALSPMNLTRDFASCRETLHRRVRELCDITKCTVFALLFDDMDKTSEDVGRVQSGIIRDVESALPDRIGRFIVCPSYYTDDPVLDRLFGERPKSYFRDLCEDLPERVEIFWTGPKVVSEDITREHLERVTAQLGRKVFIWDNYPVNDGKILHFFLYLKAFKGRRDIGDLVTGHAVNPMVQCRLSTLSELTLPIIYKGESQEAIDEAYMRYARELFGKAADELMRSENLDLLCETGTHRMSEEQKERLMRICRKDSTEALSEIIDFLQGSSRFDAAIVSNTHKISNDGQ